MRALATAICLAMAGCAPVISSSVPSRPPRSAVVVDARETTDCLRRESAIDLVTEEAIEEVRDPELVKILESVPLEVRHTARAAGLEAPLARLLREKSREGASRLDLLEMRLQLVTRMSSLEIQLSSLVFEVGCMGRQMDAVLQQLDRQETRQQLVLAIASLVVGSAAGIGAGIWQLNDKNAVYGPALLGVTAGSASVGLGIAAVVPRRGRVVHRHVRNPLTPIRDGADPHAFYPPFVLRLLTTKSPNYANSRRDELLENWEHMLDDAVHAREREAAAVVLYGAGGVYDRKLAAARERMLDELELELDGIERDLDVLYRFLALVLEDGAPPSDP